MHFKRPCDDKSENYSYRKAVMLSKEVTVNAYVPEFQVGEDFCNTEMESAIENFDFERAKVINDAKLATIYEDAQVQEEHYRKEQERLHKHMQKEMEDLISDNRKEYENLVSIEKQKLEKEFRYTERRQKVEIKRLINDWKEARAEELIKIHQEIDDILKEAQDLARNKAFDEAIEKRDYAYSLRERQSYPQLKPIDEVYQEQMNMVTARHQKEFQDMKEYHQLRLKKLKEELVAKNKEVEALAQVRQASIPKLIMSTVINEKANQEATITVMQSVSPRKPHVKDLE